MLLPQLLKQEGLVTVMVMVLMMVPDYSEGHTACTAITTIYNTTVTCLFPEDISQLGFNVQFFFPNTSADPEMLLVCNRLTSGGLMCHKGHQVLFDEKQKIAHRFTLSRPPSLSKLNRGHYQCHAVPSLTDRSEFCPLTYKDVTGFVPLEALSPPPKDGTDAIQIFILVAIVIILILLIVMISLWLKQNSVAVWCSRRAAKKERPGDGEKGTENTPLMEESSTQPPIQHDKQDPQVEGGEWRAAVDVSQASQQSLQGAALRPQPMRDRRGPRSKTTLVYGSPQRDQDCPAQQLRRQSSQRTRTAGDSEIQTETAEEATPMLGMPQGGSDNSEHGARGESKEGNTRAGKSSESEKETQERENRETSGGQESHGDEEGADTQVRTKKKWWPPWK